MRSMPADSSSRRERSSEADSCPEERSVDAEGPTSKMMSAELDGTWRRSLDGDSKARRKRVD